MKTILTEQELNRIVKRVIFEMGEKTCCNVNGETVPCKNDDSDVMCKDVGEFSLSIKKPRYEIQLKEPTLNGSVMLTYKINTGEIFGDSDNKNIIEKIEPYLFEEQVRKWLKKNGYKIYQSIKLDI